MQTHLQVQNKHSDSSGVDVAMLLMTVSLKVDDFICWLQIFTHKQSTYLHLIFSLMSGTMHGTPAWPRRGYYLHLLHGVNKHITLEAW